MKTLKLTEEYMEKRISRFFNLEPLPIQIDKSVPQAGKDIVYARQLLSVIGLDPSEGKTPINSGAPIIGAGGITITLAKCPVGQGPGLHNHLSTFETFTVLEGEFLIKWNDDGSEELKIQKYDTISIPPGVCRSFTNVGKEEGLLQVIISGGVHDMNDIAFTPYAEKEMNDIEPNLSKKFKNIGFKFDAGV
jgi:mannose-6-phosphate isomerase-like protein (cupin superfamily)